MDCRTCVDASYERQTMESNSYSRYDDHLPRVRHFLGLNLLLSRFIPKWVVTTFLQWHKTGSDKSF